MIAEEYGVSLSTVGQWWSETARELSVVETERGSNSDEWGGDNCGHVVCGECHEPLSDRHLTPSLSER